MSYLDGKNVPGSKSPYTVWLRVHTGQVLGIDYQELNKYIYSYNTRRLDRYFDFWPWFSNEVFDDPDYISGFQSVWNVGNINIRKLLDIGERDD